MSVDFDLFYQWACEYFGEENLKTKSTAHGTEICANSIWSEEKLGKTDSKHHLWMNPSGGKSKHPEIGSYRCWLTDKMGSLIGLVSELENLDWEESEIKICGGSSLRQLEQKVHEIFGHKEEKIEIRQLEQKIQLPDSCYKIKDLSNSHPMKHKASTYLLKRKIPYENLYVCVAGEFKNRIVIPYYGKEGELIYYNARTLDDKKNSLRYMKCPTNIVDQKNVLYMTEWPSKKSDIFIMEGEFDALTIKQTGNTACACGGKFMSETQIEMIRGHTPILSFDSDEAGLEAMLSIGKNLLEKGFREIYYVRPPKEYKDWNNLLVQKDVEILKVYLNKFKKPFTEDTPFLLLSNKI